MKSERRDALLVSGARVQSELKGALLLLARRPSCCNLDVLLLY